MANPLNRTIASITGIIRSGGARNGGRGRGRGCKWERPGGRHDTFGWHRSRQRVARRLPQSHVQLELSLVVVDDGREVLATGSRQQPQAVEQLDRQRVSRFLLNAQKVFAKGVPATANGLLGRADL